MRRPVIAGNWKMFKTIPETATFFSSFLPLVSAVSHCEIVVAPPFTALAAASAAASGSRVAISAQDVYWEKDGAFTGEVSISMLRDAGCTCTIIGHSERRQFFGETDETVNRKLRAAIAGGLQPIVCVGETLAERDAGKAAEVVRRQVRQGLAQLTESDLSPMIVAYEPVWAIGTGQTATPADASAMCAVIRSLLKKRNLDDAPVLYGGSVSATNAASLFAAGDIDGFLVGGASLRAEEFLTIVEAARD